MISISQLFIYPIKSMGPVELSKSFVKQRGLEHDRRWMLIDEKSSFLTQRDISELSQFRPFIEKNQLKIKYLDNSSEDLLSMEYPDETKVKVWSENVRVKIADDKLNQWFSDHLSKKVKLCRLYGETKRSRNSGEVSFADRWPYLITSRASLENLNQKLKSEISMLNFRPNIVVDNSSAYEEEQWKKFKIGELNFEGQGACGRCIMINIDQMSGVSDPEVLKTLSSYRKLPSKIPFGLQASAVSEGLIKVGQELIVE